MGGDTFGREPPAMSSEPENTNSSCNPWGKPATSSDTASPWGKPKSAKPCSLADVMGEQKSEELASQLQNRESAVFNKERQLLEASKLEETITSIASEQLTDAELAAKLAAEDVGYDPNDEVIALMLQKQFDREHDVASFERGDNYDANYKEDQDVEDVEDDDDNEELLQLQYPLNNIQRGKFPVDFDSGDGKGMDIQLPNRVYNGLKQHSLSENKKSQKVVEKKDHSTAIKAVDEKTRIMIFKMINSELLISVDGVVSEGKEAVVLKAIGGRKDNVELPQDVILKVYKTSMNEFKTRLKYVQGDYRLSKDTFKKFNARKLMQIWAEKEFLNLRKLHRNGVLCPTPLMQKKHVLAMACIGGDRPAPKLKDVVFSTEDFQDAFEQTVHLMKLMFDKCNMVHCDISPYNLLWHQKKVWVVDVSQAVDRDNPSSNSFLFRDCRNVCEYFKQCGSGEVLSAEKLFNEITKFNFEGEGKVFESQVHRYDEEGFAFDFFFELSESARSQKLLSCGSDSDSDSEVGDGSDENDGEEDERLQPDHEEG